MKVVYDETKAIATKQEIDSKYYPDLNPQLKKKIRRYRILTVLGYLLAVWGVSLLNRSRTDSLLSGVFYYGVLFAISAVFAATWGFISSLKHPTYPSAVQYHTAIQGKKVLSVDWSCITPNYRSHSPRQDYMVGVTLEDADHIVTRESITVRDCTEKSRTDISDTTLDLDEKVFYSRYTA